MTEQEVRKEFTATVVRYLASVEGQLDAVLSSSDGRKVLLLARQMTELKPQPPQPWRVEPEFQHLYWEMCLQYEGSEVVGGYLQEADAVVRFHNIWSCEWLIGKNLFVEHDDFKHNGLYDLLLRARVVGPSRAMLVAQRQATLEFIGRH